MATNEEERQKEFKLLWKEYQAKLAPIRKEYGEKLALLWKKYDKKKAVLDEKEKAEPNFIIGGDGETFHATKQKEKKEIP